MGLFIFLEAAESESDSEEDNENAHGMTKKEREHGKNTKTGMKTEDFYEPHFIFLTIKADWCFLFL